ISYSPLFRGLLFGTWSRDKTFGPDDARGPHKDYSGWRFQRHLDAVDEIQTIARAGGLSCAQLCVGVLLIIPGLTGVICGARDAQQGVLVANLGGGCDPRSGATGMVRHPPARAGSGDDVNLCFLTSPTARRRPTRRGRRR